MWLWFPVWSTNYQECFCRAERCQKLLFWSTFQQLFLSCFNFCVSNKDGWTFFPSFFSLCIFTLHWVLSPLFSPPFPQSLISGIWGHLLSACTKLWKLQCSSGSYIRHELGLFKMCNLSSFWCLILSCMTEMCNSIFSDKASCNQRTSNLFISIGYDVGSSKLHIVTCHSQKSETFFGGLSVVGGIRQMNVRK